MRDLVSPMTVDAERLDARRELMSRVDRFRQSAEEAAKEEAAAPELFSFVVPREHAETITVALGHAMDRLEGKNRRARGLVLMAEEYLRQQEPESA